MELPQAWARSKLLDKNGMGESAEWRLTVDLPQAWSRPKLSREKVDLPLPWARSIPWVERRPTTIVVSAYTFALKKKTYHNRGLGLCLGVKEDLPQAWSRPLPSREKGIPTTIVDSVGALAKKGRPTTIVVSAYTLVKKEVLPQRGIGLLQSGTTSVEASIVNTICQLLQEDWRDVCECGYLGVLDFCFRDDC